MEGEGRRREEGGGRREKGEGRREERQSHERILGFIFFFQTSEQTGVFFWPIRRSLSLHRRGCSGVLKVSVQVEGRCSVTVIVKREIGLAR